MFHGLTGTGKSRCVYDMFGKDLWTFVDDKGQWFDGYSGQTSALLDDFDGKSIPLTFFLKILDRYPLRVPVKGNFVNWRPKRIFITSNVPPSAWYPDSIPAHRDALSRRLDVIVEFPTDQSLINFD